MLHMGYICHRSAYYGLFKPLYHIKCIRTAIKGLILARILCTPPLLPVTGERSLTALGGPVLQFFACMKRKMILVYKSNTEINSLELHLKYI